MSYLPRAEGRDLSPSDYVVLGMLRHGARSGYEIMRAVQAPIGVFWKISAAQIYSSLARLELAGLVRGASQPRGRRPRRVYRVARCGHAAVTEWLRSDGDTSLQLRDLGVLKLAFIDAQEPGAVLAQVGRLRHRSEQALGEIEREIQRGAFGGQRAGVRPPAVVRIGMALHRGMIDCCAELERELSQQAGGAVEQVRIPEGPGPAAPDRRDGPVRDARL
jgi:DNA-binding PadR family transcriptional regulator